MLMQLCSCADEDVQRWILGRAETAPTYRDAPRGIPRR